MNNEKQKWKEFGIWLINYYNLNNKNINECTITVTYYFPTKHRHDADNYTPKNLFDSFTESGLLIDDDFDHVKQLIIQGSYSKGNPKTVFTINY